MLDKGADINKVDQGMTALVAAIAANHPETVSLLLERGADVNTVNKEGLTPLETAAVGNQPDTVKLLIDKGADVNAVDKLGMTALQGAVLGNHPHIVKLLLDRGADIMLPDKSAGTALHLAAISGNYDAVKALLDSGVDPNVKNDKGATALELAIFMGNPEMIKQVYPDPDKRKTVYDRQNKVHLKPENIVKISKLLLEKGAEPKSDGGETALVGAVALGDPDVLSLLLNKGYDVNGKIKDCTLLHWAAMFGKPAAAKLLLEKGANVNASIEGKSNSTPLHAARAMGHKEVEALLREHGAKE
jgi:uncharacterized protein